MIRHLVFDLDGTLVPSNALKRDAFFECVGHVEGATALIRGMLDADPTRDRHAVFSELVARLPQCGDPEDLVRCYGSHCHDTIVAMLRTGGIEAQFNVLRARGLHLHLSSGTPRDALLAMVRDAGLNALFNSVHGAPAAKSQSLAAIMSCHGLAPDDLAVIGDGHSDAAAAAAAGCAFLRVADDASDLYGREPEEAFAFLAAHLPLITQGAEA